ncbi:DUF1311 domain-containing protein [Butyrivibrio sp. X503]|uniref:lysozyme inhibitor LprI family protein n=1 Tax=Butyrivibrio sp. X503 TaxID=2364878 RepID=UPI000EA8E3C2|nr:lysozyme inhibitor LprI family protein [Butyrivibrio sp. X503]RKM54106.1 DUF1311 domain-containing protein [Butyrivibrio sp. X503]
MKRKTVFCALMITILTLAGCSGEVAEGNDAGFETVNETQTEQESGADAEAQDSSDAEASDNTVTDTEADGESASVEKSEDSDTSAAEASQETADSSKSSDSKETVTGSDVDPTKDFMADYSADIKKDVDAAIAGASSVQDELDAVSKVADKYRKFASKAVGQADMNMASNWSLTVWDSELNSLWDRISKSADAKGKDDLLAKQRTWNSMKDSVIIADIGPREESGTIYPLLYNGCMENLTYNRCIVLANELAKINGDSFKMPERGIYGTYVDDQGTGEIYSTLVITQGMEGDNVAKIALYREKDLEGSFTDKGNGELEFTDNASGVKGIIKLNGWDGATFEVTQGDEIVATGEKHTFGIIF